jgi:hypothetical protein
MKKHGPLMRGFKINRRMGVIHLFSETQFGAIDYAYQVSADTLAEKP